MFKEFSPSLTLNSEEEKRLNESAARMHHPLKQALFSEFEIHWGRDLTWVGGGLELLCTVHYTLVTLYNEHKQHIFTMYTFLYRSYKILN